MKNIFLLISCLLFISDTSLSQAHLDVTLQEITNLDAPIICNCSTDYNPVCGSTGIIYLNSCEAECDGEFNYSDGVCSQNCDEAPGFYQTFTGKSAHQVLQTFDCNYLLLGSYSVYEDFFLQKVDTAGNIIWSIDLVEEKYYNALIETNDGGILILRTLYDSTAGYTNSYLKKLTPWGEFLWEKTYDEVTLSDVLETHENDLVLTGSKYYSGITNSEPVLIKTDSDGNVLWEKTYDTYSTDYKLLTSLALQISPDGGFLFGGLGHKSPGGTKPYKQKLLKTDSVGNLLWDLEVGEGGVPSTLQDIEVLPSGEIIVIGTEELSFGGIGNFNKEAVVTKLDPDGNEIWRNELCTQNFNDERLGRRLAINNQGLIAAAGKFCGQYDYVNNGPNSGWFCTQQLSMSFIDQDGIADCKFQKYRSDAVSVTSDGGFIFAGRTSFNGSIFLAKTDNVGNTTMFTETSNTENYFPSENSNDDLGGISFSKIYPNPASDNITFSISSSLEKTIDLQIFDARGSLVIAKKITLLKGKNNLELSIDHLSVGVYTFYLPQLPTKNNLQRFMKMK